MSSYWENFYERTKLTNKPSSFAKFCLPYIKGKMIELGCGNCRDLGYFKKHGVKCNGIDLAYNNIDVRTLIKNNASCPESVYTRFFWHSIHPSIQKDILLWITGTIFIEARTTEDVPKNLFGKHIRYYVNVPELVKELKFYGFQINYLKEGRGLSKFKGEDPHLVRVIAKKL